MRFACGPESINQYAPPVAGNGDLSLLVDYQGAQFQQAYHQMIPSIWWAGRRYDTARRELVPFGHFDQEIHLAGQPVSAPVDWHQSLDAHDACIRSVSQYEGGLTVKSEVLVHARYNLVVIKKHFQSPGDLNYRFRYVLAQPGPANELPRRMTVVARPDSVSGGIAIDYHIDGQSQYRGEIALFADRPMKPEINGNCFALAGDIPAGKGDEVTFFILFADDLHGQDAQAESLRLKRLICQEGFGSLRTEHLDTWQAYWDESGMQLPDEQITRTYYASQYHLRSATTRWSIPIAIADTHWHGRYFGFDEFFGFMGLLTSNHIDLARRVPEFRYQGLDCAEQRASRYFQDSAFKGGARYPWETVETGEEAAPPGFWYDHIFQMAHIALETWYFYLYTADLDFLREKGYPVIKACAEFFYHQAIYEVGDKTIIGKCTDLERLGTAVENAYMTTCGVIAALQAASSSAVVLNLDPEIAAQWHDAARRLKAALPNDGEKYVPFPGCDQKSVAVLSGLFPYAAVESSDVRQQRAIDDFCDAGAAFGNMYPVGQSVCAWYAAWKSVIFARLHDPVKTLAAIRQGAASAGCFSELFEINEPAVSIKPWFSTAEGTYIQGVNEMLVQSAADTIWIAPAVPAEWQDYAFKLSCQGGRVIDVQVAQGKMIRLRLQAGHVDGSIKLTIVMPTAICPESLSGAAFVAAIKTDGDDTILEISLDLLSSTAAADEAGKFWTLV